MKKLMRSAMVIGISFMAALSSATLTYITPPAMQLDFPAAAFFQQPTSTPQVEGVSEIGSTDGIILLGGVIVLIVIVPIFLYRKSWMHTQ
ncbi:MAG: hypothetical protein L0287_28245 [Anaerolineae bacterium]|nr:hypothetical protein [Anaerolineae bacterium]MCI0610977.1 hypothetical protein [Anaerolineae bacterium]